MQEASEHQLLDVISASAGSGKTFTLATRFIDLLVRNPQNYQHILAVTFTIKATAEMMDRIVRDLYILVAPIADNDKKEENEKKKREIIERQIEELKGGKAKKEGDRLVRPRPKAKEIEGLDDKQIEQMIVDNCKLALRLILNDYSQFNISTIDSFVQKVLRAFAFEQGFMSNYGIELDTKLVTAQAIDMLMQDMKSDMQLKGWMIEFVRSKMDNEDKSATWEIDNDIKKLANTLTSDEGRIFLEEISGKLKDPEFLQKYKDKISKIAKDSLEEIEKATKAYANHFEQPGFDIEKLKGKSRSSYWFLYTYIRDKRIDKTYESILKIDPEKPSGTADIDNAIKTLIKDLDLDSFRKYYTAKEILSNIYVIGILGHISKKIQEYESQNHVMLLTKSNELLQELIGNSTVPFIYEKIGTRFNHIMIDEFQDTSKMQWNNFEPLVANSLHNNNRCLLVGDIKQAIYRWRNSDWHTLADLSSATSDSEVCPYVKTDVLDSNWRSYGNIVDFNNEMFKKLSESFSQKIGEEDRDISRIYANSSQEVPTEKKKGKGYVEYKQVDSKRTTANEVILKDLTCQITELKDKYKYRYSDMLILVRNHKDGAIAMDYLAKRGISVVSSDSLMVCKSLIVKGIIAAMRFVSNPNDKQSLLTYISVLRFDNEISQISELWKDDEELGRIQNQLLELRGKGLLEMTNAIISFMPQELRQNDFIFVEAFVDTLRTYMANHHVNLSDFTEYVESIKDTLSITAPSNQDAVSIMTIHKSKGLESKVVFIPFANWEIEPRALKAPIIWGQNLPEPFEDLETIPVIYKSRLENTYFKKEYDEETKMIYIDSLNLMYVALTRAKEVLMIWGNKPEKDTNGPYYKYLSEVVESMEMEEEEKTVKREEGEGEEDDEEEEITIHIRKRGTMCINEDSSDGEDSTEAISPYEFHDYTDHIELTQKNSQKAISIEEIEKYEGMIDYGSVMHQVMESIVDINDIDTAVDNAVLDGAIDKNKGMRLKNTLRKKIASDEIRPWFSAKREDVYTETTFLTDKEDLRPDRIVKLNDGTVAIIDYKFGYTVDPEADDEQTQSYHNQVRNYITTLKAAGFTNVKGYLWYFHKDVVKEIKQ